MLTGNVYDAMGVITSERRPTVAPASIFLRVLPAARRYVFCGSTGHTAA